MSTLKDRGQAARTAPAEALWREHGFVLGPWVVGCVVAAIVVLSALGRWLG